MNTEMKVTGLALDPLTNTPVVILEDLESSRAVSIWIGLIEASAIAIELEHLDIPRPMTHELLCSVVETLGANLAGVEVRDCNVSDKTYLAHLLLKRGTKEFEVEARPSDAIALALRMGSPIFVHDRVLEKSRKLEESQEGVEEVEKEMEDAFWADFLDTLPEKEFGKYRQ